MSKRNLLIPLLTALVLIAFFYPAQQAEAALAAVSGKPDPAVDEVTIGGNPPDVAVSLSNGFPLWYRDANGLKLALCLDNVVEFDDGAGGVRVINPCITEEPLVFAPISFPSNFGPEAFYWSATAFGTYTSLLNGLPVVGGSALLVLAQEAAFANLAGGPIEGNQTVFARIRIRIAVPVAGTYLITHPYGTRTYVVPTPTVALERSINQTQDVGLIALDFLTPLADRTPAPPPPPDPDPPHINFIPNGIVNVDGASIGPFLVSTTTVTALNGDAYLSDPGDELNPLPVPVFNAPFSDPNNGGQPANYLRIELTNPPPGFELNSAGGQMIEFNAFQLVGKIFNDGPNLPPVAVDDTAATAIDTPVVIDVLANDTDVIARDPADAYNPANPANTNVHGIHPPAIGLVRPDGTIATTQTLVTAKSGVVSRVTNLVTGKASFRYTPPGGFTGEDNFSYVVQDTGGLISSAATVTVTIQRLAVTKAEYRARHGRWHVEGVSSITTPQTITLLADPRAVLSGSDMVPQVATEARGLATLTISQNAIDYEISFVPVPASEVREVHIHAGAPGENGPVIFTLFDSFFAEPQITNPLPGRLTSANVQPRLEVGIASFSDAVNAILNGNAYVRVITTANPGGEIRGQFTRPLIGTATSAADGSWSFKGKSPVFPAGRKSISVMSDIGVNVPGVAVRMR